MRRYAIAILGLAGALALGGCMGREPLAGGGPPPPATAFLLSPGDKLRITTYGEPALTGEFQVSPAGMVAFPLVGEVEAAGKGPNELAQRLTTILGDGYLRQPRIAIEVLTFRPVYVLGEVNKPGEYPYTQGLTVRGAVAKADGFTYRANEKRVFVKRAGEAGETVYPLTADFAVMPGDTVRFGERYF